MTELEINAEQVKHGVPSAEAVAFANKLVLKNPTLPYVAGMPDVPWFIKDLDEKLSGRHHQKKLLLPNLKSCGGIGIFSDYSESGACSTYTFLICNMDWVFPFLKNFGEIKEKFRLNTPKKEIAFTDRDFGPLRAAMPELLGQANILNGLLFTLVVDKRLISIFGENSRSSIKKLREELRTHGADNWKPEVAERVFRILHPVGYLFGLLSGENQKVFWMTDQDNIVGNPAQTKSVGQLYRNTLHSYARGRKIQLIGFAQSFPETSSRMDVNAMTEVSDLVAGVTQFIYSHLHDLDAKVTPGTKPLVEFMGYQGVGLKKLTYLMRPDEKGAITTGFLDVSLKEHPADATVVPLYF